MDSEGEAAPRARANNSGHNMPRMEERSHSAEDSSGGRLVPYKTGKEPTVPQREVSPPNFLTIPDYPSTHANPTNPLAPISMSSPTGLNFGTTHTISRTTPIYSLNYTSPSGEVNIFFSLWNYLNSGKYSFSLSIVKQKQDKDLPQGLKEFIYPFSSSSGVHKLLLAKLVGSFQMMAAECGLLS
ncbi:hypothetical protein PVK06_039774 [Gossypium arboreum]|uniref:Uncharacterized protein n=1 Tax=Gossypium arboreum TaxID=29729 RepID=A0ABR0N3S7_GOSAR|nr:hypothetical protein PVK06_039774 [Gossypium arboreum]